MKLERSNIEFAIWRKKVDKSLFEHNGTIECTLFLKMSSIRAELLDKVMATYISQ